MLRLNRNLRLIIAAAAIVATNILWMEAASAEVSVCNRNNRDHINFAAIWDEGSPFINETWHAQGWFTLQPNTCMTITSDRRKRFFVFLSLRKIYNGRGNPIIIHSPVEELNLSENAVPKGWNKIEDFYCVKGENFRRTEGTFEAHATCPPDYYSQMFNVAGYTTSYTDLTLNVN